VSVEQEGNIFTIATPMITIHFQAKHEVAAREWCKAIQLAILRKKRLLRFFYIFFSI